MKLHKITCRIWKELLTWNSDKMDSIVRSELEKMAKELENNDESCNSLQATRVILGLVEKELK